MLVLRNIIAQTFMILMIIFISLFCYLASFVVSTRVMNYILYKTFDILRNITFKIIGIKIEYRGLENIPQDAVIFASKHQSAFETSFFFNKFRRNTIYCFKAEIAKVPLWGRIAKSNGGIAIDRGNAASFRKFISDVQNTLNIGKSVAIFPEGTRVVPKAHPKFKKGIAKIYSNTTAPIIPVALNTGDCFPRGSRLIYPVLVIIEFLPPIHRDLSEDDFMEFLHKQINERSDELSELAK
ncbi:MAG: 1-acyl-sn-glycerol-3-phosphate acyltransferase [Alphaproteobacteria bacterium]|jgi:1-acyl-sn-glycerol-3-phosphate acyltransferase|nr:1-acyl-sn-glycerol-3-phosphate acyltransferase [Alphaproteobacteria bacterium]